MNKRALTKFRFWAAVCLVLAFFLPWTSLAGVISFNGYQVADALRSDANKQITEATDEIAHADNRPFHRVDPAFVESQEKRLNDARLQLATSYLIYLIPLTALLCIILELKGFRPRVAYVLSALVTFGFFGLMCHELGRELTDRLSIGGWLTVAAALAAFIGAFVPDRAIAPAVTTTPVEVGGAREN